MFFDKEFLIVKKDTHALFDRNKGSEDGLVYKHVALFFVKL